MIQLRIIFPLCVRGRREKKEDLQTKKSNGDLKRNISEYKCRYRLCLMGTEAEIFLLFPSR